MRTRIARRGAGFTLIEVMIVITIILALTGLVAYNVLGRQKQAKADLCRIDMNTLKGAMKQFRLDFDRYPKDEEGIKVLWDKSALVVDTDADEAKWHKYLEEPLANDRWGKPWGYKQVSEHGDEDIYDLWSFGPDGQEGNDDDIVSWSTEGEEGGTGTTPSGDGKSSGG
ncbi:MAG: type II secretion system major pseudopilin GspG [Phycisphaerales bacterium]|nr:type II secretion system major pseudopilin GspG [Phycisphaerales bacterium]